MLRSLRTYVTGAFLLTGGCHAAPLEHHRSSEDQPPPSGRVAKVLAIWTDAVVRHEATPVAQGFVCRVYLVGPDSDHPVTAPGEFKFYAFREGTPGQTVAVRSNEPDRQWAFSAEEAGGYLRKDLVGWGYTFWLPWGSPEGRDRQCSLMARFTPREGRPAVTESTLVMLPGLPVSTAGVVTPLGRGMALGGGDAADTPAEPAAAGG